jgi:hypothetical protein
MNVVFLLKGGKVYLFNYLRIPSFLNQSHVCHQPRLHCRFKIWFNLIHFVSHKSFRLCNLGSKDYRGSAQIVASSLKTDKQI